MGDYRISNADEETGKDDMEDTTSTKSFSTTSEVPHIYLENKYKCYDEKKDSEEGKREETPEEKDVWAIVMDEDEDYEKFSDLTTSGKVKHVCKVSLKIIAVLACLYFFICSLSLLSSAFQILGGKTGGQLFTNELSNPISGLIIGILVTVLVQSSSTSTSIIITMVGAGIIPVHEAIPMIMGANIGTSVTNTIVSLTQSMDRDQFRRSFAGATVHDMFNFLCVLVLLPVEVATGYLEHVTGAIVQNSALQQGEGAPDLLDVITDPLTDHVIQVNKTVISLIAQNNDVGDASMIKIWCERMLSSTSDTSHCNSTEPSTSDQNVLVCTIKCNVNDFIFANTGMSDAAVGTILLLMSLFVLCTCLIVMVKILSSMLKGSVARIIKKIINTNFPFPFGWLTGYLAIIVGAVLTFLVQSSSVFTSTMTPLVGLGVISLKRMYPLTLGSNIGTTATGLLAAFATEGDDAGIAAALQLSLCHFFFNITGIVIWYPVPFMRKVPIRGAKALGNTTAKYRWFAVLYLIFAFFLIPGLLLGLSFAGIWVMGGFLIIVAVIIIFIIVINVLQKRKPDILPEKLKTWEFLPLFMRSLEPYDKFFTKYLLCCKSCKDSTDEDEDLESVKSIEENGGLNIKSLPMNEVTTHNSLSTSDLQQFSNEAFIEEENITAF